VGNFNISGGNQLWSRQLTFWRNFSESDITGQSLPVLKSADLRVYLIITRLDKMNGDRIIAGCKRLHTNALIKNEKEKEENWKSYLAEFAYGDSLESLFSI